MPALRTIRFVHYDSPEPLFIAGYVPAFLTLLLYRRKSKGGNTYWRP